MKISKSAIFLFELMFVILVFTVSAAICSNIFGQAYTYSTGSTDLTQAMLAAENAAEEFKADAAGAAERTDFYDKNWNPVDGADPANVRYSVAVSIMETDVLRTCLITCRDGAGEDADVIYTLTAKRAAVG
jgi:Tfp pilus assembly protein PilE